MRSGIASPRVSPLTPVRCITELSDAELTEAQTMALVGVQDAEGSTLVHEAHSYSTRDGRAKAAAWVDTERSADKGQNGNDVAVSE